MRLLTHNTLRNNSANAKGKGFPLKITAVEVRVDDSSNGGGGGGAGQQQQKIAFVKGILPVLDWNALVAVS